MAFSRLRPERDHIFGRAMTVCNLDALFNPGSVALIGASVKAGSVGCIVAQNLLRGGFAGPIWFVNPKYASVAGQDCFAPKRNRALMLQLATANYREHPLLTSP
jgi:hypothetical protein